MKVIGTVSLVLLLSALGLAQNRSMADASYGLKGPVRTFRVEIARVELKDGGYVEGPRVVQMEAWFNQDGNRTDLRLYNDKGALSRRIVMKFDGRKLTESVSYDAAGKISSRIITAYDNAGQMTETTSYNDDETLRSRTSITRNDQGQVMELTTRSAEGALMLKVTNRYDGPTLRGYERRLYRPDGSLQSKEDYEVANQRSELISYKPDGSVATKSVRNNADIAQYAEDGSLQKTTVIFPEDRLADEMVLNKDGSTMRQWPHQDQLDEHGNWTRLTRWLSDAKGTRPLRVEYRALTYY